MEDDLKMKMWQSKWLAAPLMVLLSCFALAQAARAQIRVACVGDSITYGVNLSGAGTATGQTFPGVLAGLLGSNYNVQNYGYPGLALMSLPGGNPSSHPAYTSTSYYTSSINFNPNIVIIMLGTNDASFTPNSGETWAQTYESLYISQYESLIQAYQSCPAHPVVYLMTCIRVTGTNQYGIDPNQVNTVIQQADYQIASAAKVPLIDAWTTSSPYGADYQDGVHPQAPLDQAIGQTIYNNIATYASSAPSTPAAPTSVTGRAGNGNNTVSWSVPASGNGQTGGAGWVTSVNVYRGTSPGGEGSTPFASYDPNRLPWYADSAVSNGTTYYYKVQAVNSAGSSALSSEVSALPASTAYSGYSFTGSPQAVPGTIFCDTFDNGGQNIAYNVGTASWNIGGFDRYYDAVSLEQNSDTTTNGYDVGWNYTGYTLNFTVSAASAGNYTVGFRVANGGSSAGSLHLQNSSGTNLTGAVSIPASGGWQTWETVSANVTLPAGTQTLQLAMDNASYNLNYLTFAAAGPPSAPSNLAATGGSTQVALTWTAGSGATSYNVYRGTTSGGESSTAIATGITSTSYTDTTVTNGTKYYYEVASVNASGTSGKSNEASATPNTVTIANGVYTLTPQNATGSNLDATNGSTTSGTQLQIWSSTSGDVNQEWVFTNKGNGEYLIQPYYDSSLAVGVAGSSSANGTAVELLTNTGASNELWSLQSASGGYTLTPENATGSTMNVTGPSSANGTLIQIWAGGSPAGTNTIFALTSVTVSAPAAPTGLTAAAGSSSIALSWTGSTGATSYNVYRGTTSGGESSTAIASGLTSATYTDSSVTSGTTYYYKVAAVDTAGTSSQSNEASATVASGPIANGTYDMTPQNATGSRLDAQNGGTANGTAVQIWQYSASDANQHWVFTNEGGSVYKISPSYDSSISMTVDGGSSTNGTAVQLWADTGATSQRWTAASATGGYTFAPQCATGSTLNVSGPSSANGTLMQIWTATGASNTIFAVGAAN